MITIAAIEPGYTKIRVVEVRLSAQPAGEKAGELHGERGLLEVDRRIEVMPRGTNPFDRFEVAGIEKPDLVAIPGGIYRSCKPGTYEINAEFAEDAGKIDPWHPRNLLTVQAYEYCRRTGTPCIVVEPMSSAELEPWRELSGHRDWKRRGVYYAVPQKAAWEQALSTLKVSPDDARGVTVYLGEEVSVTSHSGHRIVDTSDPSMGEGPYGFTSAGTLPAVSLVSYLAASKDVESLAFRFKRQAGAFAYAGVSSIDDLQERLRRGDPGARMAVEGMAYQVAKEIGRHVVTLSGRVMAIVLCGEGTCVEPLVQGIAARVSKFGPVLVNSRDLVMETLIKEGFSFARRNYLAG